MVPQQAWPEAEDELKSLLIGDDSASEPQLMDLAGESGETEATVGSKRGRKKKVDNPQQPAPDNRNDDLRASRTRIGRVRRQPTRLSFNHKDKNSVAMLYMSAVRANFNSDF